MTILECAGRAERRRRFRADGRFTGCGRFACVQKRCRAALATAVQDDKRIPNAARATGRVTCPVKYGREYGKPWRRRYFTGRTHEAGRGRKSDATDGNSFEQPRNKATKTANLCSFVALLFHHSAFRNPNSAFERLFSRIHLRQRAAFERVARKGLSVRMMIWNPFSATGTSPPHGVPLWISSRGQ